MIMLYVFWCAYYYYCDRKYILNFVYTFFLDINKEDDSKPASFTWKNHIIAPGVDFDKISFFIIGTNKNDKPCMPHVLHPPIMYALQKHLPQSCERSNFWLKYSSIRDGTSSYSLEVKSGLARYTVMAIETLKGDVFGCFMSKVS
jgi:hypothetical protein